MSKQKQTRRRFTAEFKAETVKLVKQSDRSMADLAMELGISAKSIGDCKLGRCTSSSAFPWLTSPFVTVCL